MYLKLNLKKTIILQLLGTIFSYRLFCPSISQKQDDVCAWDRVKINHNVCFHCNGGACNRCNSAAPVFLTTWLHGFGYTDDICK